MRFIVYGAGGIGGVVGGRLFQHGHDVVLIARGAHREAIAGRGLTVESADDTVVLPVPVVGAPADITWQPDDVVLLTMKGNDTAAAVHALAEHAPASIAVVCGQNGVENERVALRSFSNVYGMCVMCPTTFLVPGVVQANSTPVTGLLDVGRYPRGSDAVVEGVVKALADSTFSSLVRDEIMRWKYCKLLMNLGNAIEAVCGVEGRASTLFPLAKEEGRACLVTAGIDFASDEEDRERRGSLMRLRPINGARRTGGSSWQSLARGTGAIETDYLTGEIVLLGREWDVPTPVNAVLQTYANRMARAGAAPGSVTEDEILAAAGHPND